MARTDVARTDVARTVARTQRIVSGVIVAFAAGSATALSPRLAQAQERPQQGPSAITPDLLNRVRGHEEQVVGVVERVSQAFVAIGGGSGIIVSPEGEVLTNHHVAGSRAVGEQWIVTRPGGVFERATMIGSDPRGDISLLKLEGPGPFPYVEMADSDRVLAGQQVIALGNPFGFSKDGSPHVTVGVVSAVHRFQGGYSDAIQTDTAINPGNSGGPLLDMQGRLIGINGRIAVRFGTRANTGVGYAIPSNQITAFLPHFRELGLVSHGVVRGLSLAESGDGEGALVREVQDGSRAHRAGLRAGDVIVAADGRAVTNPRRFQGIVGTLPAGEALRIDVRRAGDLQQVEVVLHARDRQLANHGGFLGVRLSTVEDDGGVEIEQVVPGSPAAAAGLETGDVVRAIDGDAIEDAEDFVERIGRHKPGETVKLLVVRGEAEMELEAELGERPKSE